LNNSPPTTTAPDYSRRWNFNFLVLEASFFYLGFGIMDTATVLPMFLRTLTPAPVVVGLIIALQQAGWLLPQLPTASYLHHRPRKKPLWLGSNLAGRLPLGLLALLVWLLAGRQPQLLLGLLIGLFAWFFITDGVAAVPWQDMVSKCVPATGRGRCFSFMEVLGSLFALGAGEVVRRVLSSKTLLYPANYALLFGLFFAALMISVGLQTFIREPIKPAAETPLNTRELLGKIPALLKHYPAYRRMIGLQLLLSLALMVYPFYVGFAQQKLAAPAWSGGVFVWGSTLGAIVGSLAWGLLNDRLGSRRVIRSVCGVLLLTPLWAITLAHLRLPAPLVFYVYASVFFLAKVGLCGLWIGFTNFLLEAAREQDRPALVGITATLTAPVILLPILGGQLLSIMPHEALLLIAAAGALLGWFLTRRLAEPRALSYKIALSPSAVES
jgi:MFS family permease